LELKELESKLRSAYLNKERAAQIAEHEATRFETLVSASLVGSYSMKEKSFPSSKILVPKNFDSSVDKY